ncbi:PD-(D/E)XK nuclease family protein [Candidatus Amarolinea aalborgensis]|uniref:PD-(D/E)XK nuclease family protein n=1 Tax=Candidatus Amarolinea aalborgensis TaxID=2249329 RepID=UPI003BF99DB5
MAPPTPVTAIHTTQSALVRRPPTPAELTFSQGSLQDYTQCPRRFQLRFLLNQPWPALESQPLLDFEHYQELGQRFHRLIQRHINGVAAARISAGIQDYDLRRWWQAYLASPPPGLPMPLLAGAHADWLICAEEVLSTVISSQRVAARYDLLAIQENGQALIVDWKTSRQPATRAQLAQRMQSWVYPFVLVEAGADLGRGAIAPEQVRMVYWFANDPERPQTLAYSARQHEAHRRYLAALIEEIATRRDAVWPLTSDESRCRFCTYRSLCDRGVEAGDWATFDDERQPDLDFGLEDVPEIAFA